MRWNGGNQLISSAVMKCVVAAAPSVCKAVSWCPLPVPSPRAFCAPQPQSLHPHWSVCTQAHRPGMSWLSLTAPVTLTQDPDFQQFSKHCLKSVSVKFLFSQDAFSCDNILIVFGYHHSLNCHFSDTHLYRGSCLTTDDVNWDGSKCQGRKLKPCD